MGRGWFRVRQMVAKAILAGLEKLA